MTKNIKRINIILIALTVLAIILFLTIWLNTYRDLIFGNLNNAHIMNALGKIIKRRTIQLVAIIVSVILITLSSLSFQTITNNRILTPSVLGFDSIYIITQTMIIFLLGSASIFLNHYLINFATSIVVMVVVVSLMFISILRKNKNNIIFLLLLGLVINQLAGSVSNFIRVFMHPEDFQAVTEITNVSINAINENLVFISLPLMIILVILFYREHRYYDVMALGEASAINLGVEYNKKVNYTLVLITFAIAISTALVGPLSFLGLIVVNSAKELTKTNKHKSLMLTASLLAIIFILGGQVILEVLKIKTPVTVIVNLIGGLYMIYMLVKENQK